MAGHQCQPKCEGDCCGLCCTKIENFGVVIGSMTILENVNIHIHCGELTAIIGPNGAGKSTLLKAILGEVPHTGELKYLDSGGGMSGKPLIGYVPQQPSFDPGTPASVLDLFIAAGSRFPVWLLKSAKLRKKVWVRINTLFTMMEIMITEFFILKKKVIYTFTKSLTMKKNK